MLKIILICITVVIAIKIGKWLINCLIDKFIPSYEAPPYYVRGFKNRFKASVIRIKLAYARERTRRKAV